MVFLIFSSFIKFKAMEDVKSESLRYGDEDLSFFRRIIEEKQRKALEELKYLREGISHSADNGTDETSKRFEGLENSTAGMEKEYLTQMASRQIQFLKHLENALIRIENKTYGICRETGKLISKERLRAVPHATLSIEAKNAREN